MISLIQRVKYAKVTINKKLYSKIDYGMLIFIGIHINDTKDDAQYLSKKIKKLRIFTDKQDKMNDTLNFSIGAILVVSQFTLYGDCTKGNRPNFLNSAKQEQAAYLYHYFIKLLKQYGCIVKSGKFGEKMDVELINDGPVTLILDTQK